MSRLVCGEQVAVDEEVEYGVEDDHLGEFEGQDKEKAGSSVVGWKGCGGDGDWAIGILMMRRMV